MRIGSIKAILLVSLVASACSGSVAQIGETEPFDKTTKSEMNKNTVTTVVETTDNSSYDQSSNIEEGSAEPTESVSYFKNFSSSFSNKISSIDRNHPFQTLDTFCTPYLPVKEELVPATVEVKKGDSLAKIASKNDLTLSEILEINEFISDTKSRKNQIGNLPALHNSLDICRNLLNETRKEYQDTQSNYDSLVRNADECKRRVIAISIDEETWKNRHQGAIERVEELTQREAAAINELKILADYPEKLEKQRNTLLNSIKNAEKARQSAADEVLSAEQILAESEKILKFEEEKFVEARENKVRAQSAIDQAEQNLSVVRERITERLECDPKKLLEIAQISEGQSVPDLDSAIKRFDRLIRERDNMGPVNLRAQLETDELTEKISMIETEKNDLTTAISRLRQGISNLNKEARQRLVTSFEEVDDHFKVLFQRLFGGGGAKLALTDSDDPLQAGLEIYASPPGKKLQNLSLLSGGEQAMTAIALLFAVFLTNPAPICVLDEVDAALDDANVDRFCLLLSEIADAGDTRFLVITHHRMTMSRMDRLYGVTMPEQGISQLVSVDLRKAEQIRATA